MRIREIVESAQAHHYQITGVDPEIGHDAAHLTSKKGTIKASYHELERYFGKPTSYTHDQDTAHHWTIEFTYLDPMRSDPDDTDTVVVEIYDRWHHGSPAKIEEWEVNGKTIEAYWVLMDYLEQQRARK